MFPSFENSTAIAELAPHQPPIEWGRELREATYLKLKDVLDTVKLLLEPVHRPGLAIGLSQLYLRT
jgi:hypothetical protein